jgi:hypothetical protein
MYSAVFICAGKAAEHRKYHYATGKVTPVTADKLQICQDLKKTGDSSMKTYHALR